MRPRTYLVGFVLAALGAAGVLAARVAPPPVAGTARSTAASHAAAEPEIRAAHALGTDLGGGASAAELAAVELPTARLDDELPPAVEAARASLVPRLAELARWCHGAELFADRDAVYGAVLALEPGHEEAHRALRHVRGSDGAWRAGPPRDVANRSPRGRAEFERRRAEILRPFVESALTHAEDVDAPTRARVVGLVLAVDPDDDAVHAWLGEVRDEGRWVLPETARARVRRAELRALVAAARDSARARPALPSGNAAPARESSWATNALASLVRVFADDPGEARAITDACAVAVDLGGRLFGGVPGSRPTPASGPSDATPTQAVDAAVQAALVATLVPGMTNDTSWVGESVGRYVAREWLGVRTAWDVSPRGDVLDPRDAHWSGRRLGPDADVLRAALCVLASPDAPALADVLAPGRGARGAREALAGYALAGFLVEGRPDRATEFLRRSASGEPPDALTGAVLSTTPQELQARLVRWLAERR